MSRWIDLRENGSVVASIAPGTLYAQPETGMVAIKAMQVGELELLGDGRPRRP